jgi:hypothetical protein
MCQSDADCNDPNYPICDTEIQDCVAPPAQTLAGLIVDRADGSTPVHPVEVSLLSPLTGIPTGVMTINKPDGTWFLNPLDQEPKLVLFNATGAASHYVDELYDRIPCEGGCDAAILGTAVAINQGANTLNYDLAVGYTMSGTVRDEFVNPMQEVLLEIFDDVGKLIATVQTNGLGQWSLSKLRSQDYYVRTVPWTTPGYVPEIWDDKTCRQCDVLATGDRVSIDQADRSMIDFLLEPRRELIFGSGFEEPVP